MVFDEAGTYTIEYTATDDCGNTTTEDRTVVVKAMNAYGAEWAGGESSAWTRTDKAALFADPVPQMSDGNGGWTEGSSPFDNIMPWSGMEIVEDAEAGTLVKIPKYWYKWTRNGDAMKLQIANEPQDEFLTSPAHADRGDGVGERDYVYVGRYHCSNSGYKSQTSVWAKRGEARSDFRSAISALGNDVWQYDFAMYWTICMLYLVEFADWNSQAKIGYGCSLGSSPVQEGATDAMTYHTGTNASSLTNYGEVQYRHIEGLWSSFNDFVDGIYFDDTNIYVINNPSDFSDVNGGVSVGVRGTTESGVTKTLTDPSSISVYEYALYCSDNNYVNSDKYICDRCEYKNTGTVLFVGGSYRTRSLSNGLFYWNGANPSNYNYIDIGSRLMKLPSA